MGCKEGENGAPANQPAMKEGLLNQRKLVVNYAGDFHGLA